MLEELKNILGEELSKQVSEKLTEAKLELAIMNNGSVVPAEKYEKLKLDHKALKETHEKEVATTAKKLKELSNSSSDLETLKGTLETLQNESAKRQKEYETGLLNNKKGHALDLALIQAGVDQNYLELLKGQIDVSGLNFEGETLVGLNDLVTMHKEKHSRLFGETKVVGNEVKTGVQVPNNPNFSDRYKEAVKNGNMVEAIKIKNEAFAKGENI